MYGYLKEATLDLPAWAAFIPLVIAQHLQTIRSLEAFTTHEYLHICTFS
jgi:uncharacterized protein YjaZ